MRQRAPSFLPRLRRAVFAVVSLPLRIYKAIRLWFYRALLLRAASNNPSLDKVSGGLSIYPSDAFDNVIDRGISLGVFDTPSRTPYKVHKTPSFSSLLGGKPIDPYAKKSWSQRMWASLLSHIRPKGHLKNA